MVQVVDEIRKLSSFGTKSSDNSALIQSAIDSGERIYVDPGIWTIDAPIAYDQHLFLFGDDASICEIRGSDNLGDRSMFTRREGHLTFTGSTIAPHAWAIHQGSTLVELGTGVQVNCKGIHFQTLGFNNACFEAYNSAIANHWIDCRFTYRFRGMNVVAAFNNVINHCRFDCVGNKRWLGQPAKVANAWAVNQIGHATIRNCVFNDCVTGLICLAAENVIRHCTFNRCINGFVMQGRNTHPDILNTPVSTSYCEYSGLVFNDCLRSVTLQMGGSQLRNVLIKSYSAPQLDGTIGLPEFGINVNSTPGLSTVKNIKIQGTYSLGAVIGQNLGYLPELAA